MTPGEIVEHLRNHYNQLAIKHRAKGQFEHANLWAELSHQLDVYMFFHLHELPGIYSSCIDEISRMHP